jgi:hypothetical protein
MSGHGLPRPGPTSSAHAMRAANGAKSAGFGATLSASLRALELVAIAIGTLCFSRWRTRRSTPGDPAV